MQHGLHWIDGTIVASYAAGMIALGWYYSRQQSTAEYFTGGGAMSPVLIGISLFATLLSTITYLASPGEIIKHGPVILTGIVSIPISFVVVGYLLIPTFMRYRVTSAYELLEHRLGLSVRLTGAWMFIALRLMWMAVLLNFAASASLKMLGAGDGWFTVTIVAIGAVALTYSCLGGLRAVVVTDVIQFALLFGGAVLVILTVSVQLGGFGWWPTEWDADWDTQPIFSFNPYTRLTVVGVIVMQCLWAICTAGGDQTAIQRFMATRDAQAARRSYLTNALASATVVLVLAMVGFSLIGYYRAFPDRLPAGETVADAADVVFPHFIARQLPVGLSGLVISGMFAAAMSSIDSGVNSITAVVTTDFIDRFRRQPISERSRVLIARAVAIGIGIVVIACSTLIEHVPGNFLEISKRVTGLLVTPLFTLFFMALFVPFATSRGTIAGAVAGFSTAVMVAFWNPLVASRSLSITWINPCALTTAVVVGFAVSAADRTQRRRPPSKENR